MDQHFHQIDNFTELNGNYDQSVEPSFLTYKYTLESIVESNVSSEGVSPIDDQVCLKNTATFKLCILDSQLRDHLCNWCNIYKVSCQHKHLHLRRLPCEFSNDPVCKKCSSTNELFIDYRSLIYHSDGRKNTRFYYTSQYHQHLPPCKNCINCKTQRICIFAGTGPFQCNLTTQVYDEETQTFNRLVYHDEFVLQEHVRPIKCALFYVCKIHKHRHINVNLSPQLDENDDNTNNNKKNKDTDVTCYIQKEECCDQATLITNFSNSFYVMCTKLLPEKKPKEYIIVDPSIWKNQSINKFTCLIRALTDPSASVDTVNTRYKAFTNASFKTPQLSIYKSGKFSLPRTQVTGFETYGLYQTSIMSELIPDDVILIPGVLYDMMRETFDMSLVIVKRDPVFYNTSLAVFKAQRNSDDKIRAFVFPYGWGIPFYQDNDGDKNTIYFLAKKKAGFDYTKSFNYKLAKYELSKNHCRKLSLLSDSRYSLSENVRLEIFSNSRVFETDAFWRSTHLYGPQFMADAGASYLHREFEPFKKLVMNQFRKPDLRMLTLFDLLGSSNPNGKLQAIVDSKSKGNQESVKLFEQSMRKCLPLNNPEKMEACINQYNNYSQGNQHLRHHGKEQFVMFYSMQDMITMANLVYMNKKLLADLASYAGLYTYVYTEASLICFKNDLLGIP